jgi:capsular polysaccharide biosynthesis protein
MKGFGESAADAEEMANRAADAFVAYLTEQQVAAEIPEEKRVEVMITSRATPAEVFEGRSLARPIVVFIAVLAGFVGLAFLLDNLRPQREPMRSENKAPLRSAGR